MSLALTGTVSLDGSGFEAGLHKLSHGVGHLSSELKGMALQAFGIYGVEQAIHKTVETAEELVTASKRMGMGVEGVQVLKQAAKESETELAKVEGAFEKINVAREKALGGDAKTMGRFQHLGINESNLRSMNAAELFMGPMSNAAKTRSVEDLAPDFRQLMGREFGELVPVLKTNFEELEAKMKHMGAITSTETAVSLKMLAEEASMLSRVAIAQLAPALVMLAEISYKFVAKLAAGMAWIAQMLHGKNAFTGESGVLAWLENFTAEKALRNIESGGQYPPGYEARMRKVVSGYDGSADAAALKYAEVDEKFKATLDEIKRKIADDANRLRNPPKPVFETEDADEKTKMSRFKQGDSLVRVGNFLGGSKTALESIGETHVELTRQVVVNTANIVDRLNSALNAGGNFGTDIAVA